MRLVDNYGRILRKAWSIRLMLLAGLFSGAEVALPLIDGLWDVPQGVFAALSGVTTAAAFVSRFVAQSSIPAEQPK